MKSLSAYVVFLVVLVLGLSPAVPAEDLSDTTYDESEPQPFDSRLSISNLMGQTASAIQTAPSKIQAVQNALHLQTATPFLLTRGGSRIC